ncbi:MAG TPA: phosphatase PAP2 family protein [Micromonosporaceae bacterium]|nr:phosphatase PAP2 family protein [Micromonosporaceae bacterium]
MERSRPTTLPATGWRGRLRPVRPAGWWPDAALLLGFVAVTVALVARTSLLDLDTAVADWCDAHRPRAAYWIARSLNYLGQGGWLLSPLALAVAVLVGYRARSVRPVLPVIAAFLLTYLTIGPLKLWTNRDAATSTIDDPELLFHVANGRSYPSGHVVNAIVWYGVFALLLAPVLRPAWRRALRVVPPIVVLGTTTYLSYHWVSDGVAAVLLGLLLDRLMRRVPWDAIPLSRVPLDRIRWGRGASAPRSLRGWDRPAGLDS